MVKIYGALGIPRFTTNESMMYIPLHKLCLNSISKIHSTVIPTPCHCGGLNEELVQRNGLTVRFCGQASGDVLDERSKGEVLRNPVSYV